MRRSTSCLAFVAVLAALTLAPAPAGARARGSGRTTPFEYTTPANVLRAQAALERLGLLKRGDYTPGEINEATHEALRDFQRSHSLRITGHLDWETYALLPIDGRPDKDDDGVADPDDRCPGSKKGVRVAHDGCPLQGAETPGARNRGGADARRAAIEGAKAPGGGQE
jgi:hypothetical protein